MWPRNLLRKTCFSTLVQINERRLDSSIIRTRSADRSASVTRVNEHASDIKTASGLADALSSKTAVRPSKPLLLSGDKCLFTLRIEPLSMQSKSIQVDGEKRRRFETIRRAGWKNNEADYRNARLKSEGRSHRHWRNGLSRWRIFFSAKSNGIAPPKSPPLKPWPLCAALRWILHERLPPPFHSLLHPPALLPASQRPLLSHLAVNTWVEANASTSNNPRRLILPLLPVFPSRVPSLEMEQSPVSGREREKRNSRLDDRRGIEDKRKRQQHSRPTYAPLRQVVRSNRAIRRFFFFFLLVPRRRDRREECTTRSILGGIWWTDSS